MEVFGHWWTLRLCHNATYGLAVDSDGCWPAACVALVNNHRPQHRQPDNQTRRCGSAGGVEVVLGILRPPQRRRRWPCCRRAVGAAGPFCGGMVWYGMVCMVLKNNNITSNKPPCVRKAGLSGKEGDAPVGNWTKQSKCGARWALCSRGRPEHYSEHTAAACSL